MERRQRHEFALAARSSRLLTTLRPVLIGIGEIDQLVRELHDALRRPLTKIAKSGILYSSLCVAFTCTNRI